MGFKSIVGCTTIALDEINAPSVMKIEAIDYLRLNSINDLIYMHTSVNFNANDLTNRQY